MTIWPELDTMSKREKNPQILTSDEADELNLEIFPYWLDRSVLEVTRKQFGATTAMNLMARIVFFIVIPTPAKAFYLRFLAGLVRTFDSSDARKELLDCDEQLKMWKTLVKLTRETVP